MNYYKRHIGDYLKDTLKLTMLQDGAYCRLLDLYYSCEKPLPLDKCELYTSARCQCKTDREAVDHVLKKFFQETAEGYRKNRCEEEIEASKPKIESNRENGKRGGRPKKITETPTELEPKNNPMGFETETQTEPIDNLSHKPLAISHKKDKETTLSGKPDGGLLPCREILSYLNERAGKNYRAVPANIDPIRERIKSGVTVEQCRQVVDAKCAEWLNDQKMAKYLRPETLFGRTKFESYLGSVGSKKTSRNEPDYVRAGFGSAAEAAKAAARAKETA